MTTELEGGDRQKAMKRLRVPPLGAAQVMDWAGHAAKINITMLEKQQICDVNTFYGNQIVI